MKIPPLPPGWIESLPGPVLVTGAKGMLGWEWTRSLAGARVAALGRDELDVTNESSVQAAFSKWKPSVVLHCAAYTNVDKAESEREEARLANAVAPALVARACAKSGARLVHYGTDQVFDGEGRKPREESDRPNPLNHYAATKLEGEKGALSAPGAIVLRVQWLYGEKKDRFTILKDKDVWTPFSDQWGAPTWTRDIVNVSLALLARGASGLFHLSHDDYATWADVFAHVKNRMRYQVELRPKETDEFHLPAKRPRFSVLSNRKICSALEVDGLGAWRTSLDSFLDTVGGRTGR